MLFDWKCRIVTTVIVSSEHGWDSSTEKRRNVAKHWKSGDELYSFTNTNSWSGHLKSGTLGNVNGIEVNKVWYLTDWYGRLYTVLSIYGSLEYAWSWNMCHILYSWEVKNFHVYNNMYYEHNVIIYVIYSYYHQSIMLHIDWGNFRLINAMLIVNNVWFQRQPPVSRTFWWD